MTQSAMSKDRVLRAAEALRGKPAEEVLRFAAGELGGPVKLASSFGVEDVVLIDLARKVAPSLAIFTLDTGRLPEETFEVMERVRYRYEVELEVHAPEAAAVEALTRAKGFYSFRDSIDGRRECCRIRKVEPLRRALAGCAGWVTGLRREQSPTRAGTAALEWDEAHGLAKVSPLVEWTEADVWAYVKANKVPYNKLHDRGYPSIGCAPCTRAVSPGEDVRAGRWWWENPDSKECGLHK